MNPNLIIVRKQLRRQDADDGCVTCGITIPSALTWAHVHLDQGHDPSRVFRLCWTCHRLYDHGIIKTAEIEKAEDAWVHETRPQSAPWFCILADEVSAGRRKARPEVQHKGAQVKAGKTVRRRNAALKAAATRKKQNRPGRDHGVQ